MNVDQKIHVSIYEHIISVYIYMYEETNNQIAIWISRYIIFPQLQKLNTSFNLL